MTLYFVTGNKNKFDEVKKYIPEVEQLNVELPEIQSLQLEEIVKCKLLEARKHHSGVFIVEDTSLELEALNGLPGPLIKWFMEKIGCEGLYGLVSALGNDNATARTIFGYYDKKIMFFEGSVRGNIVSPRGSRKFGWDPIFQPEGYDKTFAEMSLEEKNDVSHRGKALRKLCEFLKHG